MGKMKSALMDWNLENGYDICTTGHHRKPTLKMILNGVLFTILCIYQAIVCVVVLPKKRN